MMSHMSGHPITPYRQLMSGFKIVHLMPLGLCMSCYTPHEYNSLTDGLKLHSWRWFPRPADHQIQRIQPYSQKGPRQPILERSFD